MKCLNFTKKWMTALVLTGFSVGAMAQVAQLAKSVRPNRPAQSEDITIYLSETGNDSNDGLTLEAAVATLPGALTKMDASSGTILVKGTILVSTTKGGQVATGVLLGTNRNLTIEGIAGTSPRLLGDRTCRMFNMNGNNYLSLKNLTLAGAEVAPLAVTSGATDFCPAAGGAVFMTGGTLSAEGVTFEKFASGVESGANNHGATIMVEGLSPIRPYVFVKDCLFKENRSAAGAGIRIYHFGDMENVQLWVENCAFVSNIASTNNGGAAIFVRYAPPSPLPENPPVITVINTTVTGNNHLVNGDPGVITIYSANLLMNMLNCTVKDNITNAKGVCLFNAAATANIINSVLDGNVARDLIVTTGVANLYNTFVNNTYVGAAPNAINYIEPSSKPSFTGSTLFETFDPVTNSFKPRATSAVLNFGNAVNLNALNVNYDQLNARRNFVNNKCDAGAIELAVTEWTGGVDDNWSVNGNWTKGTPDAGYTAAISAGKPNLPVILSENAAAKSLTVAKNANIDLAGFFLEVGQLEMTTVLDNVLTDNPYASIGFPFAPTIKKAGVELKAGVDFTLKSLVVGAERSEFEPATAITANTGYFWNWINNPGTADLTLLSGKAKIGGSLIFDNTYRLQANPNFVTTTVLMGENEHLYKLNAGGDAYEEVIEPAIEIAPFEAVITIKHPKAASEIVIAEGVDNNPKFTIGVSANPTAGGNVNGGGTFTYGTEVTVIATANAGYEFVNWTAGAKEKATTATYTFNAEENISLVANFTKSTSISALNGDAVTATEYYNLQGVRVANPQQGSYYIVKSIFESGNTKVVKQIIK